MSGVLIKPDDPVPPGWRLMTLIEACREGGGDIQTGPFGSQLHAADYVSEGIPSIMPQNIGDNRVIEPGIARIRASDASRLARYRVQKGDIVYSRRGDVERRAFIRDTEDGWICGTGCLRVRLGDGDIDPTFVSYYLAHPRVREWIVRHAHGATMLNLNTSILGAVPLLVPPHAEQRAIADLLGVLDDKIDLNRKLRETIEAALRTLFKGWFLNRALGQGWPEDSLGNHIEVVRGLSYTGAGLVAEGVPLHNLDSVREGGGYKHEGIKYYAGEFQERHLVLPGDLVVANTEQGFDYLLIGCPAIVPHDYGLEGLFSHHLFRVRPRANSPLTARFLYLLLCDEHFRGHVTGYSNGTTVNMLASDGLLRPKLAVPPAQLVARFDELTEPLFARQAALYGESTLLARLRDMLLPRLLSGELRVRHPEPMR
jgi:type I restriction enzyme S subunit